MNKKFLNAHYWARRKKFKQTMLNEVPLSRQFAIVKFYVERLPSKNGVWLMQLKFFVIVRKLGTASPSCPHEFRPRDLSINSLGPMISRIQTRFVRSHLNRCGSRDAMWSFLHVTLRSHNINGANPVFIPQMSGTSIRKY